LGKAERNLYGYRDEQKKHPGRGRGSERWGVKVGGGLTIGTTRKGGLEWVVWEEG